MPQPSFPRMSADVYHPCIHLFSNFWTASQVSDAAAQIKETIFGSANASTCYQGPSGTAQLAVQTEFTVLEFSGHSDPNSALELIDQRLDALLEAGLAVHFLLPVHQLPQNGWQGINWQELADQWPGGTFDPYQPSVNEFNAGEQCPYDIIVEHFHKPVIEHLVETGRAEKLAVIYTMNEFGYPSNELLDSASNWGGAADWHSVRAQALKNTAQRNIEKCRTFASGKVPVGLKFARATSPNTGWTPFTDKDTDQLSAILNIMGPAGDILGYDVYFNQENHFDEANKQRFAPFLHLFPPGNFEISESAWECSGDVCQFNQGRRTTPEDIIGVTDYWSEAQGFNLFAWNASGQWEGCYAIIQANGTPCSGGEAEIKGLWDLILHRTNSPAPTPCPGSESEPSNSIISFLKKIPFWAWIVILIVILLILL